MEFESKEEMLKALEIMRLDWATLLEAVEPEMMEQPGVVDDWAFRDVISHLTGWRKRTVARFEAAARGTEPAPPHWPAELEDNLDGTNDWIYESDRKRPVAEVLADSDEVLRRLDAAIRESTEEDLLTPGRFTWMGKYAMADSLGFALEHYYVDHAPGLAAWVITQWRRKAISS